MARGRNEVEATYDDDDESFMMVMMIIVMMVMIIAIMMAMMNIMTMMMKENPLDNIASFKRSEGESTWQGVPSSL